jgi:hypothetical protein
MCVCIYLGEVRMCGVVCGGLQFTNFCNKLEYLSLASIQNSLMFAGKAGAYPSEALIRPSSLG